VDMNPSTPLARMRDYIMRESTISSMNILDEPRFSLSKLGGLDWKTGCNRLNNTISHGMTSAHVVHA